MKKLVIFSITLIILYVIIKKPDIYTGLLNKITDWIRKGVKTITTGQSQ